MALAVAGSPGLTTVSGVFTMGVSATAPQPATAVSLAGYDAIVQMSRDLLGSQVEQSLAGSNLSALSASLPWNSVSLPASLLAAIPQTLRLTLSARVAYLEVRLVSPFISDFHWPDPPPGPPVGLPVASVVIPGQQRSVDLGWQIQINVAIPGTGLAASVVRSGGSGEPNPVSVSGAVGAGGTGTQSGNGGSQVGRTTLATGTAVTTALAELAVASNLWIFGMNLDFSGTSASLAPGAPAAISDFLATADGQNLLNQALGPLRAAAGIQLTPEIAPGGALSASFVRSMNLPPFNVGDILLSDANGNPVLCLLAELGSNTGGVARLVQPFLNGADFAYGVSTSVLNPALTAQWNLATTGLTIVGNVPVDVPANGSSPGFTGRAQLRTTFSTILNNVSIEAATVGGDAVRLLSSQTIQLLNLWDQNGKPVTNLGALTQPQTSALVLPVQLSGGAGPSPDSLQSNFQNLLVQLMLAMVFPILDPFPVDSNSITGFASSALGTLLVRWALVPASTIVPVGGFSTV